MSTPNRGRDGHREPAESSYLNFLLGAIVLIVGVSAAYEVLLSADLTYFFVGFVGYAVIHLPYLIRGLTERA